ncbi:MAG: discoidin domain-containing protein, partial [Candidatus Aureabacteria bacterium]|nr:discoidin domain-containing protein [Candidatus Auribacterota bacterium]
HYANVMASSVEGAGLEAEKASDGDLNTRWASDWSDNEWIYIDFGTPKSFNTVILEWEIAYGKSYQLQISNDATHWQDIYSTTTGDGGIDEIRVPAVNARYLRMYGTECGTGWGYSLWEMATGYK